jgi:ribosomal protein S18 acetylase RimI-like enzyme
MGGPAAEPIVRAYQPGDLPAIYDICVRTADSGGDARGIYSDDRLMGDLFAASYVTLEPQHAYVLDAAGTTVGYVLGTADTSTYVRRHRAEWIPALAGIWSMPPDPPVTAEDAMLGLLFQPEQMLVPELVDYPAHLHIDLLPDWQGRGFGRALIDRFLASVAEAGVTAVHLGMLSDNVAAAGFYQRLGFHEIAVADVGPVTYLGRSTEPLAVRSA